MRAFVPHTLTTSVIFYLCHVFCLQAGSDNHLYPNRLEQQEEDILKQQDILVSQIIPFFVSIVRSRFV